jgi:hypothetical protein
MVAQLGLNFARRDLKDCVYELRNKQEPGRADLLYKKAIRMGRLIAVGDSSEVADALFEASVSNGLVAKNGESDVRRQIVRGFETGVATRPENEISGGVLPPSSRAQKLTSEPLGRPQITSDTPFSGTQNLRVPPSIGGQTVSATPFIARDAGKIPPRQWAYGRHYIRKYVTTTVAGGGFGKSAIKLTEAISMAIGRNLLDNDTPIKRLRVWYWNGEDPREEIERRVAAICQYYRLDPRELEGWLFIDSGHDMPICLASELRGSFSLNTAAVTSVSDTIDRNKIDVVIFDPFIAIHAVSENNNPLIDQVVKCLGRIANQTNCAIEIVHHVRKPSAGQHEVTADDTRGGGAIVNAVRSCQVLNRMSSKYAAQAGIEPDQHFRYIRIDSGKQNLAPPEKAKWRYLESVTLPNGDSVQVPVSWQFPDVTRGVTPEDMERIRSVAGSGNYRWNSRAEDWIGYAVAGLLGKDAHCPADKEDIKKILNACCKNGMIAVEVRRDANRRERQFVVAGAGRPAEAEAE